MRKAIVSPLVLPMAEDDLKPVPSKGWAEMIRKVYEVDPLGCVFFQTASLPERRVRLISGALWRQDGLKQISPTPQACVDSD